MTEDLSIFFSDFAETAIFHTESGDITVKVIYENPFVDSSLGLQVLDTTAKVLYCENSKVGSLKRGDEITHNCTRYSATRLKPDGTGVMEITLSEMDE